MGNLSGGQMLGSFLGFALFGAMGASIGGYIGGILDPYIPDAPDLSDLDTNTYIRNKPVPVCIGTNKVYGGVIFIGNNYVDMENQGSKKNPSYEARYYADFAVAMSEGEISEFGKYLINDEEIEDAEEDSSVELDTTEYLGTSNQITDPTIFEFLSGETYGAIPFKNTAYVVCSGCLGSGNNLPTISNYVSGILLESDESDSNQVNVIYNWLINKRWGMGIDENCIGGSPTTVGSTWKTAYDICNVLIPRYTGCSYTEPRFRFSKVYTDKMKGYDILTEILQTCRGFLYMDDGKLQIKIENADEKPVFYFGDKRVKNYSINAISSNTKIYADFSNIPEDYHNGDLLYYTIDNVKYYYVVIDQTSTYVDILYLDYNVSSDYPIPELASTIYIEKDNIKLGTFQYSKKAMSDTYNRIRVEFINRLYTGSDASDEECENEYRDDFIEKDNVQNINETNDIRTLTVTCEGIKKRTYAARLASYFKDVNAYINYQSSFETDIVGYLLKIGDIIGVSHTIPGWEAKLFRIINIEETESMEIKLTLIEYNSSIYHDATEPIDEDGEETVSVSFYSIPSTLERFKVVEDYTTNKLYFLFKRPYNNPTFIGASVYKLDDETSLYDFYAASYTITPSVSLLSDISDFLTDIYFDNSTMYDSFDSSGSFWVDEEEIYYESIDDVNFKFLNCVRGYNGTTADFHNSGTLCYLRKNYQIFYEYSAEEIGFLLSFKAFSLTSAGIKSNNSVSSTITINGRALGPAKVSLLELNSLGNGNTLNNGEDAVLIWLAVTDGINKGYGYSYGYEQYGFGQLTGVYQFKIEIYKTSTSTLLREEYLDMDTTTYTYSSTDNISDNGSFETDLTFKVFQINSNYLFSLPNIIVTNS